MQPASTPVPEKLDDPPRLLFFEMETAMIFISCAVAFQLFGRLFTGMLVGAAAGWAWSRLSASQVRGLAMHLAYWHLGLIGLNRLPSSSRRFIG